MKVLIIGAADRLGHALLRKAQAGADTQASVIIRTGWMYTDA